MANGRPWYQRNGSAFVMGVLHMPSAEHKWAYSAIIDMLNDRDMPLPDDAGFICGFTGLSKRKWREVREFLINDRDAQGETRLSVQDGYITNPRFERERAQRRGEHERYVEAGREGGIKSAAKRRAESAATQGNFDLSPEKVPHKVEINASLSKDKSEINNHESQNSADQLEAPPQASRAGASPRQSPEIRRIIQTTDLDSTPRESDRLIGPDDDLMKLLERVGSVAGFVPTTASRITNSIDLIKSWRDAGIDFNATVIPVIERTIAESHEPTGSLSRFDRQIRHEHARANVSASPGTAKPKPLAPPRIDVEGEDPSLTQLRKDLHAALGTQRYVQFVNRIDFEIVATANGSRPIRAVHRPGDPHRLLDNDRISTVKNIAKKNGFTDVWE